MLGVPEPVPVVPELVPVVPEPVPVVPESAGVVIARDKVQQFRMIAG